MNALPGYGQFALNSARQVVLAQNPNGVTVEVTVRQRVIDVRASDVTIRGLVVRHSMAVS